MECDTRHATGVRLHDHDGENECDRRRERREEREMEQAAEAQTVWRDAPAKFAANH
jgi:hypothetical protein